MTVYKNLLLSLLLTALLFLTGINRTQPEVHKPAHKVIVAVTTPQIIGSNVSANNEFGVCAISFSCQLLCSGFAVLLDFFLVSCLFWMLVMGVVISRMLLHPPPKRASCLATMCMMAGLWGKTWLIFVRIYLLVIYSYSISDVCDTSGDSGHVQLKLL